MFYVECVKTANETDRFECDSADWQESNDDYNKDGSFSVLTRVMVTAMKTPRRKWPSRCAEHVELKKG